MSGASGSAGASAAPAAGAGASGAGRSAGSNASATPGRGSASGATSSAQSGAGSAADAGAGSAATGRAPSGATAKSASPAAQSPAQSKSAGTAGATGTGATAPSAATSGGSASPAAALMGRLDLPPINEPGFSRAHAGPSVRKLARELGVDLTRVRGQGFKGRVPHDDVKAYVKGLMTAPGGAPGTGAVARPGGGALPAIAPVDFAAFGPVETQPLSRIQRISGPRLHASWVNVPHVTQFDEADITELEALRGKLKDAAAERGIKLTPLAFIIRACVKALQAFPQFNASLDSTGANLILKKYVHVGFAADTPNGLMVPVVRDADRKDIYQVARQLGELSEAARGGKLTAAQMQGGCFTISSLGGIGGTAFTPIINAPEVAILGVSRSTMKPVYQDGTFVPRLMLPLSLSYDHRVIDGATAARFTTFLAKTLADPHSLIEAVP